MSFVDNVEMGISLNVMRRHLSKEQRDKLILALREKGWTQKKVAETAGVSQATVSQKENMPNIKTNNSHKKDRRRKIAPKEEEKPYLTNSLKGG